MGKDPAFLFYYQDFLVGTSFMTLEEVGAYIKLLCFQAAKGPILEKDILKKIPPAIWEAICCKFVCENGLYANTRLSAEMTKRRLYCENRRKNLHMDKHMDKHMGGAMTSHMENENENENTNKNIDKDRGGYREGKGMEKQDEGSTELRNGALTVKTPLKDTSRKYFYSTYEQKTGHKYIADFGKDGAIFKDLLEIVPEDELKTLIDRFFETTDDFIIKAGFTTGVFKTQVNKLRAGAKPLTAGAKTLINAKNWMDKTK